MGGDGLHIERLKADEEAEDEQVEDEDLGPRVEVLFGYMGYLDVDSIVCIDDAVEGCR